MGPEGLLEIPCCHQISTTKFGLARSESIWNQRLCASYDHISATVSFAADGSDLIEKLGLSFRLCQLHFDTPASDERRFCYNLHVPY
jgi:hypothetical protein